jgi:hypothetical protein
MREQAIVAFGEQDVVSPNMISIENKRQRSQYREESFSCLLVPRGHGQLT